MPRSPQRQFRYRLMAARGCGSVSQPLEHAFRPDARRAPHHESAEYVDRGRSREVAYCDMARAAPLEHRDWYYSLAAMKATTFDSDCICPTILPTSSFGSLVSERRMR